MTIIVIFGFWTYAAIKAMITTREEKQNLLLQKNIEGNLKVLEKEIVTNEDYVSDTLSCEITIYSEIEQKHRNILIT